MNDLQKKGMVPPCELNTQTSIEQAPYFLLLKILSAVFCTIKGYTKDTTFPVIL